MNKLFSCSFLFLIFFSVAIRLFGMPDGTDTPAEMPTQTAEAVVKPAPDAAVQPMPDATAQTAAAPQSGAVAAQAQPVAAASAPVSADDVKAERLGEFQLNENQSELINENDPKVRSLVNRSNELSKQIDGIASKIKDSYDKTFSKFSEINNSLDTFYQKVAFESGRAKELLKEEK